MSIYTPQDSPENPEVQSGKLRTVINMANQGHGKIEEAPQEMEGPVSIWLYLAGLMVTLSGLYAVNYGMDDPNYALVTYGLAICGYVTSYVLRVRRIPLQSLRVP